MFKIKKFRILVVSSPGKFRNVTMLLLLVPFKTNEKDDIATHKQNTIYWDYDDITCNIFSFKLINYKRAMRFSCSE